MVGSLIFFLLLTITKTHAVDSQTFLWCGWLTMNERFDIIGLNFSVNILCASLLNLSCDLNIISLFSKQFFEISKFKSLFYYTLCCSLSSFIITAIIFYIAINFFQQTLSLLFYLIHPSLIIF